MGPSRTSRGGGMPSGWLPSRLPVRRALVAALFLAALTVGVFAACTFGDPPSPTATPTPPRQRPRRPRRQRPRRPWRQRPRRPRRQRPRPTAAPTATPTRRQRPRRPRTPTATPTAAPTATPTTSAPTADPDRGANGLEDTGPTVGANGHADRIAPTATSPRQTIEKPLYGAEADPALVNKDWLERSTRSVGQAYDVGI